MSLSISGVGAVSPVYSPLQAPSPYAQSKSAGESVAETTAGAEAGAAAVVYQPGSSDGGESYVYSNTDRANRGSPQAPISPAAATPTVNGDESIVAATGSALLSPGVLSDTPAENEARRSAENLWAPVGPAPLDPAAANVAARAAPVAAGQSEAAAQATYAAIVDASIAGASISELEKFA